MRKIHEVFNKKYYLDLSDFYRRVVSSESYQYDHGVYLYNIDNTYPLNSFYNSSWAFVPVVNFQIGLHCLNQYLVSEDVRYLNDALSIVENSLTFADFSEEFLFFRHDYYQPLYRLNKNWVSGMAQGLFISLCVRLYLITSEEQYSQYARQAYNVMALPVDQGGCRIENDFGYWYEEYPSKINSYVLNGNIFSIFALVDLNQITDIKSELNKATDCLLAMVPEYYLFDGCCRYDLGYAVCNDDYLKLHYKQLNILVNDFDLGVLKEFLDKTFECTSVCSKLSYRFKLNRFINRFSKLLFLLSISLKEIGSRAK